MKRKGIFILTVLFFLIANTFFLWSKIIGGGISFNIFLILLFAFVILISIALYQIAFAIQEQFEDEQRILLLLLLSATLVLTIQYPKGVFYYKIPEKNNLLVAYREGTANCNTTLKLKKDSSFIHCSVCFGIKENKGDYRVINDTIYFENVRLNKYNEDFYKFALIKDFKENGKFLGSLTLYKSKSDTIPRSLLIIENELNN